VDTELRQLRRVRWAVRGTLALGISASLAANVLHAHHLLIDQIIAGWPPVAVFATIEAIARVPIRKRWLAVIRMAGLGFVAGIAFWVSYWHMASVAATHGENGSKYLLPLSVDGLVLVSSISLVELTAQISTAEAAARAAQASNPPAATRPAGIAAPAAAPASAQAPANNRPTAAPSVDAPRQVPDDDAVRTRAAAATAARGHDGGADGEVRHPPALAVPRVDAGTGDRMPALPPRVGSHAVEGINLPTDGDDRVDVVEVVDRPNGPDMQPPVSGRQPASALPSPAPGVGDVPPANTGEAVAWWRARHPDMPVREICAKVGRSERTVRRILDALPPADQRTDAGPADTSGHRTGVNGAAVPILADPVTSQ
jgi:hypothetical protein